jgi:hypothetical protein
VSRRVQAVKQRRNGRETATEPPSRPEYDGRTRRILERLNGK